MKLDVQFVENVVKQVLARVDAPAPAGDGALGVFADMNDAIEAADAAQRRYMRCSLRDRAAYIQAIRDVALDPDNLAYMARAAVEETGMGNAEHKRLKNTLVANKTPGIEDLTTDAMTGDDGLTLVEYSPFGVIGAITPTTNPTETILCNAIGMLASGNAVVFSPHPRAKNVCLFLIRALNAALTAIGAPAYLITTVSEPSLANTQSMMAHPKVRMLVATGGPGLVKAVLASGKKAIGAGAGNPPVVVDDTADIEKAAKDIVDGCSFDNNIPCVCEKEVIAVDSVADFLIFNMKKHGAFEIKDAATLDKLAAFVLDERGGPHPQRVGKDATFYLDGIGVPHDGNVRVIIAETDINHPFVQRELMMPILPIVRAPNVDAAIDIAIDVEHGNRHTAIMHSKNVDKLSQMAKAIQTTVFVKNGPAYAGLGVGGEGFTSFTIAGPTGEGLTSARTFARRRRCVLVGGFDIR